MAVTVSCKNYNQINLCENASDWTGETPSDVSDFYKRGSQCVGFTVRGTGNNDFYISVTEDLSNSHLRFWFMTVALKELQTESNGGIQVYLSDGSNTGYYYVGGSDTYPGGWYPIVLDCTRSPNAGSAPTLTSITTIGIRIVHTANAKNSQNTWIDHIYAGDGLISYGDNGDYFDFDDILAIDENTDNGWGLIRKIGGIFFTTGVIQIGDSAGTNSCKFNAQADTLVFENRKIGSYDNIKSGLMGINIVDNGTGTTEFILGTKAGVAGVSGCNIRVQDTAQTSKFYIDGDNTNVDNFKLYGCSILDASTINFPANATNVEVLNCTFESCGDIYVNTCLTKFCSFISANDAGCVITSTSHHLSYCNFINCNHGTDYSAGTYSSIANQYINCTYDIEFSTTGELTINVTLTPSNAPSTYEITGGGSSVSIVAAVTLKITNLKSNSEVRLIKKSDNSEIDGTENSGTVYQYDYNWTGDIEIWAVVLHIDYEYIRFGATLSNSDQTIPVFQSQDRNYSNP